ncbi:unnamed protein product [Wickerhamomyces anomalus]
MNLYEECLHLAFKQVINDQTYLIVKNQKFKWDLLILSAIINEDDTSNMNDSSVEKPFVFIGFLSALCRYKESGLAKNFRAKFYNKVKQIYQLEVNDQKTKEPSNSIRLKYSNEIISQKFEGNTYERMDNDHISDFVRHFIQWTSTLVLVEDDEPNFKLFITKFNAT